MLFVVWNSFREFSKKKKIPIPTIFFSSHNIRWLWFNTRYTNPFKSGCIPNSCSTSSIARHFPFIVQCSIIGLRLCWLPTLRLHCEDIWIIHEFNQNCCIKFNILVINKANVDVFNAFRHTLVRIVMEICLISYLYFKWFFICNVVESSNEPELIV